VKKVLHHIRATTRLHTVKVNRAMKHNDKTRQARPYGAVQSRVVVTLVSGEQTTVADELQAAQVKMMKLSLSLDGQARKAGKDTGSSNPMEADVTHNQSQGLINPVLDDPQHASTPLYPHPTPRVTKFSPLWRN